jgi:hypothetical protein
MNLKQRWSPKKKRLGPDGLSTAFYQTFKKEPILTLLKLFHEIEKEGTLPNSFYEISVILTQKPNRTYPKKRKEGHSP